MIRHLRATLIIGTISAGLALLLFYSGITASPDKALLTAYSLKEHRLTPIPTTALLLAIAAAFAIAWTTVDITQKLPRLLVAGGALLVLSGASWVVSLYGTFFSPILGCAATLCSLAIGWFYSTTRGGSRKRNLERLFGRRLSQSQLAQLLDSSGSIEFPGTLVDSTVMIVAIQNHAELMESMSPETYGKMTNFYLQASSDFLVEIGGYLDQCDGESLRVVFGTPVLDNNHAVKACRAALELTKRMDTLNMECDSQWQHRINLHIGIHSGPTLAAVFGGSRLGGFSISGSTPEFARKLCTLCSSYGCRILIASDTFELAVDTFEARPIELIQTRDSRRHLELYEVLAPKHALSSERQRSRDHFWKGVIYYREGKYDPASEEFAQARIRGIPDPVLDFYIERTERTRRGENKTSAIPVLI